MTCVVKASNASNWEKDRIFVFEPRAGYEAVIEKIPERGDSLLIVKSRRPKTNEIEGEKETILIGEIEREEGPKDLGKNLFEVVFFLQDRDDPEVVDEFRRDRVSLNEAMRLAKLAATHSCFLLRRMQTRHLTSGTPKFECVPAPYHEQGYAGEVDIASFSAGRVTETMTRLEDDMRNVRDRADESLGAIEKLREKLCTN